MAAKTDDEIDVMTDFFYNFDFLNSQKKNMDEKGKKNDVGGLFENYRLGLLHHNNHQQPSCIQDIDNVIVYIHTPFYLNSTGKEAQNSF